MGQSIKFSALKDKATASDNKLAQKNDDGVEITPINNDANTTNPNKTAATTDAISEPKAIREPYSDEAFNKPLPAATKAIAEKDAAVTNAKKPADEATSKPKAEEKTSVESAENIDWAWPTKGKVVANFNEASNKGLDIAGTTGQAVNAAAAGKVIYSGSDLRGYGNLVIIKHNSTYLSVYANNSQILIKEGQVVSRGQKIAEMGNSDSNSVKLHFEIRRQGKSVDPSKYLAVN